MDELKYAMLTEVHGRWKADILESFLRAEGIDVVLNQEAVSHVTHVTTFAPVKIYVPKASLKQARTVLKTFTENHDDNEKEKKSMVTKREQVRAKQAKAQQASIVQIAGVAVGLILVVVVFWFFSVKRQIPQASVNTGDQTACKVFSDISAAPQYSSAPPLKIDKTKQYFATVKMAKGGEFVIQFHADKAPITVNSFVFLACKGFFNGVTFHRVLDGFMAQGGDPAGTGMGGPGYQFVNEDSDLTFDKAGVVAMANAGRDTNGSQFFITFAPTTQLNGGYTIFGEVVQGMDVVNAITRRDPQTNPTFTGDAMKSVTITEK